MKFSVVATSLFCAVFALAQTPGFTINTPVSLCSFPGLVAKDPSSCVHNGDDPSGPAIADLGEQPAGATSFSWQRVTFQANTRLGFSLRDQTGATAQSAAVTVQAGPDNSCLNGGSSSSDSDSASGTTSTSAAAPGTTTTSAPAAPTTTAPGASSTTAAVTSGASTSVPRTSSVTSSGTAAPAQTSNAASAQVAQIGAAGLVGAALVAILA
ncbi:hypothetical protein CCMSSC00406_0008781 [Pleurotus cornucopiae]|uniref:Uncharacterized protein n=1 Tax=Pleurotus cornucopiae TaxID=5321 RepID=A0ACB7J462_PLECO|nr:hypothetical protein CCMSSC00406_0008781 [Pleurotus cornucopiae]